MAEQLIDDRLMNEIRQIMDDLVNRRFKNLVEQCRAHMPPDEIDAVLNDYPFRIVSPPPDYWSKVKMYSTGDPERSEILVPFWTHEEGESDLCMIIYLLKERDGYVMKIGYLYVP